MAVNRRFKLVRRPKGMPVAEDFTLVDEQTPALADGQFLLQNHYASLDPAQRGWMDDTPSYLPPVQLGDPMRASTVGRISDSRNPDFPVGAWAAGLNAIENFSICENNGLTNLVDPKAVPSITNYLSSLGTIGLTAYFGLLEAGQPKSGETVLVTGAAGAVGSLVGQIAKMKGCRTIGVAGGPAKCERLIKDYRYDIAVDYRGKSYDELAAAIREAAPDGIDVHFENVGGEILDAGLLSLNEYGRVVLCGMISQYNDVPYGIRNLWQLIVQGARIQGFIVKHYIPRMAEALGPLSAWVRAGELRMDEHIDIGIENALPAFLRLFEGTNQGKMILQLAA